MSKLIIAIVICSTFVGSTAAANVTKGNHRKDVVINEIVVPLEVPVFVPAAVFQYLPALGLQSSYGGYSMRQESRQSAPQVDLQKIDAYIKQRVDGFLEQLERRLEREGVLDPGPPLLPASLRYKNGKSGAVGTPDRQEPKEDFESLNRKVAVLFSEHCAKCHTQGKRPKGGVVLFKPAEGEGGGLVFDPNTEPAICAEMVVEAYMPPAAGGDPASEDAIRGADRQLVIDWANAAEDQRRR